MSNSIIIPAQTKFWGVYGNHPVCLSVSLSVWSRVNLTLNLTLAITFQPIQIRHWDKTFLFRTKKIDLVTLILTFDLVLKKKNLTLAITFEPKEIGLSYYRYVFLWQHLSICTKSFDPVTLTFDLLLKKKLNLDHNFWTKTDRVFLFHHICKEKKLAVLTSSWEDTGQHFDPLTLAVTFDLILRKWKCFMITIISSQVYKSLGWRYFSPVRTATF